MNSLKPIMDRVIGYNCARNHIILRTGRPADPVEEVAILRKANRSGDVPINVRHEIAGLLMFYDGKQMDLAEQRAAEPVVEVAPAVAPEPAPKPMPEIKESPVVLKGEAGFPKELKAVRVGDQILFMRGDLEMAATVNDVTLRTFKVEIADEPDLVVYKKSVLGVRRAD